MSAREPRSARPALVAGGFGLLWLLALGGSDLLDPRELGWLLRDDWAQHLTGWLFFRQSAWELPLGSIPDLAAPAGTTVGYTDSLPWLALLFKALDPLLPAQFTYIGAWLLACFVLQGVFGARLLRSAGLDAPAAALGGCLFATAPVLAWRVGHDALCAHFLLLAALELSFRRVASTADRRRIVWTCAFWTAFAAGIHPYLSVMVTALCAGAIARLWWAGWLSPARGLTLGAALAALLSGLLAALGYLGTGTTKSSAGFGKYSSDLLAPLDSRGFSRFVPGLGVGPDQYEGFAYLGLGILVLGGFALAAALAGRRLPLRDDWRTRIPVFLAILLLAVLAWSHRVTWRGELLLDYSAATSGALRPVLETFRASGRFIWPLHYAIVTLACVGSYAALRGRPRPVLALFSIALALQIAEQFRHPVRDRFPAGATPAFSVTWDLARGHYRSVSLHPPLINASGIHHCDVVGSVEPVDLWRYALLAHRLGLPFNSASVARANEERSRAACRITQDEVRENRLAPDKLYLTAPEDEPAFRLAAPDSRCARIDGVAACVSGRNRDAFAQALARHPERLVPEPAAAALGCVAAASLLALRLFKNAGAPAGRRCRTSDGCAPGSPAPRARGRARSRP